jgi:hypothetical protein
MKSGFRKMRFTNGDVWGYRIGAQNVVLIDPHGVQSVVKISTLLDRTWTDLERDAWKNRGTPGRDKPGNAVPIKPSDIKAYVERMGW